MTVIIDNTMVFCATRPVMRLMLLLDKDEQVLTSRSKEMLVRIYYVRSKRYCGTMSKGGDVLASSRRWLAEVRGFWRVSPCHLYGGTA